MLGEDTVKYMRRKDPKKRQYDGSWIGGIIILAFVITLIYMCIH